VVVLIAVAAVASGDLLVGDHLLLESTANYYVAQDSIALSQAQSAEKMLSPWPDPAELLSKIYLYVSIGGGKKDTDLSVYWAKVALDRDPTNASLLIGLAGLDLRAGFYSQAVHYADLGERYAPYTTQPLEELAIVALVDHNNGLERKILNQVLVLDPKNTIIRSIEEGRCRVGPQDIALDLATGTCAK
jgi:hypothetical protein